MNRALVIALAAALTASCGSKNPAAENPRGGLVHTDTDPTANLIRDLEAAVLMNYSQLSLGNYDAYMDGVAQDVDLAFLGVSAGDVMVGPSPRASWVETKPFYKRPGVQVFSKNLRVSLARDNQVGWISDEVSYRVPFLIKLRDGTQIERTASIPIRVTAAFVRDVDRWVMVMEHSSYGLRAADILDMARGKTLEAPAKLPKEGEINERTADEIASAVESFHRRGEDPLQSISSDERVLLMLPDGSEYRGEDIAGAPRLSDLFGGGSVQVVQSRVSARIGRTAWMLANLRITTGAPEDRTVIWCRGSYILEAVQEERVWRWHIVQAHISVPLSKDQLYERVFGKEPAPETDTAPKIVDSD